MQNEELNNYQLHMKKSIQTMNNSVKNHGYMMWR